MTCGKYATYYGLFYNNMWYIQQHKYLAVKCGSNTFAALKMEYPFVEI
jgi:hypothetical protein